MDKYHVASINEIKRDLHSISDWYADIADGEKSAVSFRNAAQSAINSLEAWPNAHPLMFDDIPDVRRIQIPNHKVAIVFKTYDDTLEVIAVMAFHTLQNPAVYNAILTKRVTIADNKVALLKSLK